MDANVTPEHTPEQKDALIQKIDSLVASIAPYFKELESDPEFYNVTCNALSSVLASIEAIALADTKQVGFGIGGLAMKVAQFAINTAWKNIIAAHAPAATSVNESTPVTDASNEAPEAA